ncbi:class I adenylate-forming enzyme family protein [Limibacillus sp. MBR-115]|jgi:acyl-CoA synthetase (AMP-forming)/AMP-acid ligase II|uniref:class I adenylate-forming enzyme family protein n=1 Tax=Limibacillus sp. MBR-115 TaxID=3156465 RepID=UPI003398DA1C
MLLSRSLGEIKDVRSGEVWTADDLRAGMARCRAVFQAAGVGAGDNVVIGHGGTARFFSELFAVWSLRATAVCTNPSLTRNEVEHVLAFVEPKVMSRTPLEEGSSEIGGVPLLDLWGDTEITADPVAETDLLPDEDWPALILFTSGTTGTPKGVVHSAATLRARLRLNLEHLSVDELKHSLCVLPTHFGHGLIGNCLTPLAAGCRLLLYCNPGVDGAARLASHIDAEAVTFMSSVPSFWKVALRAGPPPVKASLKRVHVGSAPLAADLWQAIEAWTGGAAVWNLYGLTETANWTAGAGPEAGQRQDGLVGSMWGGEAAVLSAEGEVLKVGEGEVLLKTPSLMVGYYKRPDLTAEVIQDGWYRTGDHGRIDEDGVVQLVGRRKNEINRAGMKVLPEEIDLLLERHPDVLEACAFGLPDPISGETVAVAVRLGDAAEATPQTLKRWCTDYIRQECIPERWFVVGEIPKTDRGKINRDIVREACLASKG